MKKLLLSFTALALTLSISSCRETPEQSVEVEIDQTEVQESMDNAEETVIETEEAIDDAAEDLQEEVEESMS